MSNELIVTFSDFLSKKKENKILKIINFFCGDGNE